MEEVFTANRPADKGDVLEAVDRGFLNERKRAEAEARAKNADFSMVFKKGWARIRQLAAVNPTALKVWAFLAENAGPNGSLMISQDALAEAVGTTSRTVRRAITTLEDERALFIIREAGGLIYCLDPAEVWKAAADQKNMSPFRTQAIFSTKAKGVMRRRLTVAKFAAPPEIQSTLFDLAEDDKPDK